MNPFKSRKTDYTKIPVELHSMKVSSNAKVLYALACSWDPFFFSYKKIREVTGMHNMTVSRALKELLNHKMLTYVPGYGFKDGKGRPNVYTLNDTNQWVIQKGQSPNGLETSHLMDCARSHPVSADRVTQSETINNTLNNNTYTSHNSDRVYHDENSQARLAKSLVSRPMNETEVKEFAVSMRGKQAIDISKVMGQKSIPIDLIKTFVYQYLDSKPITENDCNVLENLGKTINRKDSITKAIVEYYNEFGKLEL